MSSKTNVDAMNFLNTAKKQLASTIRKDRLSLLADPSTFFLDCKGIKADDISPRNVIPPEFMLRLTSVVDSPIVDISLFSTKTRLPVPLPDDKSASSTNGVVVDALINLKQSLECCVVAIDGESFLYQTSYKHQPSVECAPNQVSIMFRKVDGKGNIDKEAMCLRRITNVATVRGINQNFRLRSLDIHVQDSDVDTLLFDSLRHFVEGNPKKLLNKRNVRNPAPKTFNILNKEQKQVADLLTLQTATEVAGPPGTGKTKTITEMVRALLECTDLNIIVLSERNGAIDAITEKLAGDCIDSKFNVIKDLPYWLLVMAAGSSSVGASTKLFTLTEKLNYHPELCALKRKINIATSIDNKLKTKMLLKLADCVEESISNVLLVNNPRSSANLIRSDAEKKKFGASVISFVLNAIQELQSVLDEKDTFKLSCIEGDLKNYGPIVHHIFPTIEKSISKMQETEIFSLAIKIQKSLSYLIDTELFSENNAKNIVDKIIGAEKEFEASLERLELELPENARVLFSTIGSSQKLPKLSISKTGDPTIVIFDEAGCIPSFEFLMLSRLERDIRAIVCVGDKHQLPPFNPGYSHPEKRYTKTRQAIASASVKNEKLLSLLDVSKLREKSGKVLLTTQYRVPRDIARILNVHIYKGKYNTPKSCNAPLAGFKLIHVPKIICSANKNSRTCNITENKTRTIKKYVNDQEIQCCKELVRTSVLEGFVSLMVLTPYKKQQREMQFQFKEAGFENISVLTIDQCQGQEADIVILSLVQKPTRFLDIYRFNVALSRVRKKLYMLTDVHDFKSASNNIGWDCHLLARDLLLLDRDSTEASVQTPAAKVAKQKRKSKMPKKMRKK